LPAPTVVGIRVVQLIGGLPASVAIDDVSVSRFMNKSPVVCDAAPMNPAAEAEILLLRMGVSLDLRRSIRVETWSIRWAVIGRAVDVDLGLSPETLRVKFTIAVVAARSWTLPCCALLNCGASTLTVYWPVKGTPTNE
jgi:hypothetical protein